MPIKLSKSDYKKLETIFENQDNNISLSNFYIDMIDLSKSIANKVQKETINKTINGKTFIDTTLDLLDVEDREWFDSIKDSHKLENIKSLDINDYKNNAYYKNIKPKQTKNSNWELKYLNYKPYEVFVYKDTINFENNIEQTCLGYFKEKFSYLAVLQDNTIWMSVTPNEIETMKEPIDEAHGNVITYGLGLGYFPYMVHLKENVSSVTIIEKDPNAIKLFEDNILPLFEHKEKIKVINIDAFEYIKKTAEFDYAFIDLWHTVDDGLKLYVKMKNAESNKVKEYSYWIEDSLVSICRRCMVSAIYEELNSIESIKPETFEDKVINTYRKYISESNLDNYESVIKLLKKENLIKLLKFLK